MKLAIESKEYHEIIGEIQSAIINHQVKLLYHQESALTDHVHKDKFDQDKDVDHNEGILIFISSHETEETVVHV